MRQALPAAPAHRAGLNSLALAATLEALDFGYRLVDLGGIADAELSHEPGLRAGFMALKYATRPPQQPSALVEMIRAIEAVPGLERCLLEYVQETWSAIERATLWRLCRKWRRP